MERKDGKSPQNEIYHVTVTDSKGAAIAFSVPRQQIQHQSKKTKDRDDFQVTFKRLPRKRTAAERESAELGSDAEADPQGHRRSIERLTNTVQRKDQHIARLLNQVRRLQDQQRKSREAHLSMLHTALKVKK